MSNMIISTSLSRGNDAGYTENIDNIKSIPSFIPCIVYYNAEKYYRFSHMIHFTVQHIFFYPNNLIFNLLALLKLECLNLNKMCIVLAFLELGWYENELEFDTPSILLFLFSVLSVLELYPLPNISRSNIKFLYVQR